MTWISVNLIEKMMQERSTGVRDSLFSDWVKWRAEYEPEGTGPTWSCHVILEGVKYRMEYRKRQLRIWDEKWMGIEDSIVFTEFSNYPILLIDLFRLQTELDGLMIKRTMEE